MVALVWILAGLVGLFGWLAGSYFCAFVMFFVVGAATCVAFDPYVITMGKLWFFASVICFSVSIAAGPIMFRRYCEKRAAGDSNYKIFFANH